MQREFNKKTKVSLIMCDGLLLFPSVIKRLRSAVGCASAPSQVLIWPERRFHQGWIKHPALKPCHSPATGTPSQQPLIYKQHFTSAQRYELDCRIQCSIWAKRRVNFTWAKRSRPERSSAFVCLLKAWDSILRKCRSQISGCLELESFL